MSRLCLPLSDVTAGNDIGVDAEVDESDLRPEGAPECALRRVGVSGALSCVDSEFLFRGRVSGTFESACDRCLEPARRTIEQDVVWYFEAGTGVESGQESGDTELTVDVEEDDEGRRVRFFFGQELDLGPHVWEEVMLSLPTKFYCKDDCAGLCARCGANLNAGPCGCETETDGEEKKPLGFAALKDMYPDLPADPSED